MKIANLRKIRQAVGRCRSRQRTAFNVFSYRVAALLNLILVSSTHAQIQQAWVARYNNGLPKGTSQAVNIVLDSAENIYVTGLSENSRGYLGYVTIKYAPNGNQVWAARYDKTNASSAQPFALALDSSNSAYVTGTAVTLKYDTNGNELWSAPYAGSALAVGPDGGTVVTGISTNFGTVKLSAGGSNLWTASYSSGYGPSFGQAVVIDPNNNSYVSGSNVYTYLTEGTVTYYETDVLAIKYGPNGNQLWTASPGGVLVAGAALDGANDVYILANAPGGGGYWITAYNTEGNNILNARPNLNGYSMATGFVLDSGTNVIVTGKAGYGLKSFYGTYKISAANGETIWTNAYPQPLNGVNVATSIAVDAGNNSYVTGYSPGTNSLNNIVTIKYGPNGNQIWLQSYSSPGNGNAAGNAIAVDTNGNVYVAGYDTTTAGGTEMVLIKYSPLTLQKNSNGSILLQAQGSPGESFDIQASADLQNWLDLGPVIADTNGLMQYTDTNASNFAARFYYTNPQ